MRRSAVWWTATAIYILQALRLRHHLSCLRRLEPGKAAPGPGGQPARTWHWILAEGLSIPAPRRRKLEIYAEAEALDVLDVVPRDLPIDQALRLLVWNSPANYRSRRLAQPITALQAILVEDNILERSGLRALALTGNHDPIAMQRLATELVRAAPASKDIIVTDGVRAVPEDPSRRRACLRSRFGLLSGFAVLAPTARLVFLAAGLIFSPISGGIALVTWCLQPVLALAGTPLRPRGIWWGSVFRWAIAPVTVVRVFAGRWRPDANADGKVDPESLRPVYADLLAHGTSSFFEQRRPECPMCGCGELSVLVRFVDLIQRKPGRFVLERCSGCRHVFQNPRLSPEGLDFYYRDFYEGLGREIMNTIFASDDSVYRRRASLLDGLTQPGRWLDVGAGHGHFCLVASEQWPETCFDGLDMSKSIEEAENLGWVETGYRGQLLDLAPELIGRYDVVSMFHYLEHTRDPLRELDAARSILAPGGYLVIEMPDPDCLWGRMLGQYWMPWLQPQHQHLIPYQNLCAALLDRGFEIVRCKRGAAAQPCNLAGALLLLLFRVAPPPGLPWRQPNGWLGRARFQIAVALTAPLLVCGVTLDFATLRWYRNRPRSNAFRIVAHVSETPKRAEGDRLGRARPLK